MDLERALEDSQFELKLAKDDLIVIEEYKAELENDLGDTKCEEIIEMPEMDPNMMMD